MFILLYLTNHFSSSKAHCLLEHQVSRGLKYYSDDLIGMEMGWIEI